jgi:hypothetical protein
MSKHGVETHIITQDQEIQKCTFCRQMMLTLFWDFNGPILEHYQDRGQMINSAQYCAMPEEELKLAICSKHKGILTKVQYICSCVPFTEQRKQYIALTFLIPFVYTISLTNTSNKLKDFNTYNKQRCLTSMAC